jgi:hypothetical protein
MSLQTARCMHEVQRAVRLLEATHIAVRTLALCAHSAAF